MEQHQQTQQTEKLIKEMLEFLDESTTEEEDDDVKLTTVTTIRNTNDGESVKMEDDTKKDLISKKDKKSKIKKLKQSEQQHPIWNTKEIASNKKKSVRNQKSPVAVEPIWHQSSPSLLEKLDEPIKGDNSSSTNNIDDNWHSKFETNNCRNTDDAYIQEVQKAIYGDTTGHPANESNDYYQAAQNYAIYGKNFLDFPQNVQSLWNDKSTSSMEANNYGSSLYAIPPGQGVTSANAVGFNNYGKYNTATSNVINTSVAVPTAATTAAYYQMCNAAMQPQTRPTVGNIAAGNAATYGLFLGNKITYFAAAPGTPSIVYNQHTTASTNSFVSNNLANAALATSPAILYSNPVLTTTTQQCLNTFFKETQFLTTGGATAATGVNTAQGTALAANTNGIYERLIYAQMLQQQFYQQSQQAAAAAAIFQHKQRTTAAAVTAARQTANVANVNSSATTVSSSATPIGSISNSCGRNSAIVAMDSLLKQKSPTIIANGNDEVANVL